MKRSVAALVIVWRLSTSVVASGWHIAWRILRRPRSMAPGFVDYEFQAMGVAATTLLACLISLTPGTTAVEVDAAAGRMRLHLLDTGNGADRAALQDIRLRFEGVVRTLFNREINDDDTG